jgi:hypothetical protein
MKSFTRQRGHLDKQCRDCAAGQRRSPQVLVVPERGRGHELVERVDLLRDLLSASKDKDGNAIEYQARTAMELRC